MVQKSAIALVLAAIYAAAPTVAYGMRGAYQRREEVSLDRRAPEWYAPNKFVFDIGAHVAAHAGSEISSNTMPVPSTRL
jgi:hypothetical protein